VGVSRSAVAQWETGRAGQVTANLTRVASVLGVGVEYLMYGHDKAAPGQPHSGDEIAVLRLYRECSPEDRQLLLRMARRLAKL
jgi:transcriptional regulator with XRE-family HTH domain